MSIQVESPGTANWDDWANDFERRLQAHRARAEQLLEQHRRRTSALEQSMGERLASLSEAVAGEHERLARQTEEQQRREAVLVEKSERLARLQEELEQRERRWREWQEESDRRSASQLEEARQTLRQVESRRAELAQVEQEVAEHRRLVEAVRGEIEREQAALKQQRAHTELRARTLEEESRAHAAAQAGLREERRRLEQLREDTEGQRRAIARELRARRNELFAELEAKRSDLLRIESGHDEELRRQLAEAGAQANLLGEQLVQKEQQLEELHEQAARAADNQARQLADLEQQFVAAIRAAEEYNEHGRHERQRLEVALAQREAEVAKLREELESQSNQRLGAVSGEEVAALREENHALVERVAQLDVNLKEHEALRRRLELAVDEVKELRAARDELEAKLKTEVKAARVAASAAPAHAGEKLDWEAQKRRLLARLEDDNAHATPEQKREILRMEEVVRVTDAAVAERDRQVRELQQLLENQSSNIGAVAVGAAAIAEILEKDELLRQERDNLKRLQDEWREMLRQAEVDVSVERAKLAREKAELEDRLQRFERERAMLQPEENGSSDKGKKSVRGRWLTRLGLGGDKDG